MTNTGLKREEMRKVTFRMGEDVRGADFVLIKKQHRRSILYV